MNAEPSAESLPVESGLVCAECGVAAPLDARGWRAYLTADDEEPVEVVILCPECAAREFDDRT